MFQATGSGQNHESCLRDSGAIDQVCEMDGFQFGIRRSAER